jgi:hypothetical protein
MNATRFFREQLDTYMVGVIVYTEIVSKTREKDMQIIEPTIFPAPFTQTNGFINDSVRQFINE